MNRSRLAIVLALVAMLAFGAGWSAYRLLVGPVPWPSTRPVAAIDRPPAPTPPWDADVVGVPHTRAAAQAFARKTFGDFGRFVQNFESDQFGTPGGGMFFLPSRYSGWPGLCQATAMWVDARPDGAISSEQRFLVVGSFESPPVAIDKDKPGYAAYKAWEGRIDENCAARDASTRWFTLEGEAATQGGRPAWDGARLIDGIVKQARTATVLPFSLDCDPSNDPERIFCANARRSLAAIDPADLASIATRNFIRGGVDYLETVIDTRGHQYVEITIRQEAVLKPDGHGGSPFGPIVKRVAIARQWQPDTD